MNYIEKEKRDIVANAEFIAGQSSLFSWQSVSDDMLFLAERRAFAQGDECSKDEKVFVMLLRLRNCERSVTYASLQKMRAILAEIETFMEENRS